MNQLTNALIASGVTKASKIIEDYQKQNKLEFSCIAWDYQEEHSILILKINLWCDKATGILSNVYLTDKNRNRYIYSFANDLTKTLDPSILPIDLSGSISVLCNFEHYIEKITSISLDDPKALSFIFTDVSKDFKEFDLTFKLAKKPQTIKLSQLIDEVPTILGFATERGEKEIIDQMIADIDFL